MKVARWPFVAIATMLILASAAPHATAQEARPAPDEVWIDMSALQVGERFQGAKLGMVLRRSLVVRFGKETDLDEPVWFQVELYDPEGIVIARHASPHVNGKPGMVAEGWYLFPEKSAGRFPEIITGTQTIRGGNTRIERDAYFSFSDKLTYLGEEIPDGPAFRTDLFIFEKDSGAGARQLAKESLYYVFDKYVPPSESDPGPDGSARPEDE